MRFAGTKLDVSASLADTAALFQVLGGGWWNRADLTKDESGDIMANEDYIERLKQVIFHLHKSGSFHLGTVPVKEVFHGTTLWEGDVEMFDLLDHPKAQRCYGWSYGEPEEFIVILELSPVTDAQSAVKAGVADQTKKATGKRC